MSEDPRVKAFEQSARRFCRVIETRQKLSKRAFVHQCAELIADLHGGFMRLLSVRTRQWAYRQHSHRMPHKKWWQLMESLRRKLGKDDLYYEVFDPYKPDDKDPIAATLGDDLADIYRDLKDGLDLIDCDDPRDSHDGVWNWKFNFLIHTGQHCGEAIRALQRLVELYHEDD